MQQRHESFALGNLVQHIDGIGHQHFQTHAMTSAEGLVTFQGIDLHHVTDVPAAVSDPHVTGVKQ